VHAQPAAARPLCPSHWQAINFFFFFFLAGTYPNKTKQNKAGVSFHLFRNKTKLITSI
jgi:hypothetical protein